MCQLRRCALSPWGLTFVLSDAAIGSGAERVFTVESIDQVQERLNAGGYVCGRALATVVFLSLKLGRPLFLEGEAGVGKTEIAKALAACLGRNLIRLQCYEGLDASSAV